MATILPQVLLLGLLVFSTPGLAARVVSLNLCTDELLVLLAPDAVAALSPLARDPSLSVVARQAAGMTWVRADAEAVLRLHPDLVLAGAYGAQFVLAVLRARGLRVVQVQEASDFAGVARQVMQVAGVLGVQDRGEQLVAQMWARLAAAPRHGGGSAILWQARGLSAGPGSFGDAVLRAAGLSDAGTGRQIGVEALVAHPPAMLVTDTTPAFPALATAMLAHPALGGIRRVTIDPALLACPGPWSAEAVLALTR